MQVWYQFKQNLIWRVSYGQTVRIWLDHWVPGIHTLGDFFVSVLDESLCNQTMVEYATINGDWHWESLGQILPKDRLIRYFNAYKSS